jgi:DNA polymerase I-like protein with 3'-5' exonuclease and polymerase domains
MTMEGPYWSELEETEIVWRLYKILTHEHADTIGQNFIYDRQYIARRWGFRARMGHDTMVKHHLCFPGTLKGLDFLSSIYCRYHLYWKDESKDWDPKLGEEQLWIYNCKDAVTTFEANAKLEETVVAFNLEQQLAFQMSTAEIAFDMMLRGILVNLDYKMDLHNKLTAMLAEQLRIIKLCTGIDLEPSSPKQVQSFCYDVLRLPPIYKEDKKNKTRRLTADKEAIEEWIDSCDPLFKPLLQAIVDYRSLTVYNSTFALARLDDDGRFRCSINIAGTETFRWSTSEDAFGYGTNMQNIPRSED